MNLLIGFMSPQVDPELEVLDGASLPTKDSDEFKPFVRRLPEFKFWYQRKAAKLMQDFTASANETKSVFPLNSKFLIGGSTRIVSLLQLWLNRHGGIILGADTRATKGPIVADENCKKIHYMAPNIYCCGVGTATDTEAVTVSSQLQLHRCHTGRESRVVTALTLLKKHLVNYQGYVRAALVLGGVDVTGPHFFYF